MGLLRKVFTGNYELSKVQDNVSEAFSQLFQKNPILNGVFISDVSLSTSDLEINHGLGRDYQGYLVVELHGNATVYTSPTANPRPQDQIILRASTTVTAKIYVF